MTRTTPIILDRLDASLMQHGVRLKRSQLLETAAMAFGYHNSNEFSSAARAGDLNMPQPDVLGRVSIAGVDLVALRDHSGGVYAIDESFIEKVVDEERRERFGPSPYGGLVDLSEVGGHPLSVWESVSPAADTTVHRGPRFVLLDAAYGEIGQVDDEAQSRDEAMGERAPAGVQDKTDVMIVDMQMRQAIHYDWGWRNVPVEVDGDGAMLVMAAALAVARIRLERSQQDHDSTLRLDVPDWRAWEKDLKKTSRKRQEPISDEILHQFRHAIADVTSKSSSSQKSEVVHRQSRYVEKHLGGLIARLDRAEEALRATGIAPAEIARKSKDDAAEALAAIDAVTARRKDLTMHNLYEVDATRDGEKCREVFTVLDGQDPDHLGRRIAARAFRMNLEDYRFPEAGSQDEEVNEDGRVIPDYSSFDGECDTFDVSQVTMPEAAAIISDALSELSVGGDFRFGIPHDHPARIKLIAARRMIEPRPTVTDAAT